MTDINLYHSASGSSKGGSFFGSGIFISVVLLILVLAIYGGLKYYNEQNFVNEMRALEQEINTISSQLVGEDVDRVNDFWLRLEEMRTETESDFVSNFMMSAAQIVLPGVVYSEASFDSTERLFTVQGIAEDQRYLAQQLYEFKLSEVFIDPKLTEIGINSDDRPMFEIQSRINLSKKEN